MVDYGWPRVKYEKNELEFMFFFDFYIDAGGPGGHSGGSRTHPRGEKHQALQKHNIFVYQLFAQI